MTDSIFPEADREWLAGLIRTENAKLDKKIDALGVRLEALEERQDETERAALKTSRDSSVADLEQQREIAELWKKMSESAGGAAGALAGKESADSTSKKWTAISAGISLLSLIISTLLARMSEPATPPERKAPATQTISETR